jgi:hypothetical protein
MRAPTAQPRGGKGNVPDRPFRTARDPGTATLPTISVGVTPSLVTPPDAGSGAKVDTHEFSTMMAPETLYLALEPIIPPAGIGACATYSPALFETQGWQQLAFDGEPVDPELHYAAARAICMACTLLDACRKYADDSREEHTFLAGMTAAERSTRHTKKTEIAKRRRQVQELHRLGASTSVIAELMERDPSLIRGDLRALQQQIRSGV